MPWAIWTSRTWQATWQPLSQSCASLSAPLGLWLQLLRWWDSQQPAMACTLCGRGARRLLLGGEMSTTGVGQAPLPWSSWLGFCVLWCLWSLGLFWVECCPMRGLGHAVVFVELQWRFVVHVCLHGGQLASPHVVNGCPCACSVGALGLSSLAFALQVCCLECSAALSLDHCRHHAQLRTH